MTYDCIVIGIGGVGSAAIWEAAKRGWKVLGIDRFGTAHDRGSSHGQSRIIRRAYFEHPHYVPLVNRAYELWDELTKRHRTSPEVKPLLLNTGLLQVGHPDSSLIRGVQTSAATHDLRIEVFTPNEIEERLPILNIPHDQIGIFEAGAGVLRVERCVAAMIGQATKLGAEIVTNTAVQDWFVEDNGTVVVKSDAGDFRANRLVIAAGPWSSQLLSELHLPLKVLRKQQQWFQLDRVEQKLINRFPAFLFEQTNGDVFYGIPELDYLGMKVCEHSGGEVVKDPANFNRELNAQELSRVEAFMKQHFRFGHHRMVHFSQCMYTMSQDEHFIIDCYPPWSQVAFAAGLSGHGFKFTPALGEHLIRLVDGQEDERFEFLKIRSLSG